MRLIDATALREVVISFQYTPTSNENERCVRAIDSAPTVEMPGWTSVKDRLPEYTGWYLTFHHAINLCVVSWFTGDGWEDGDWGAYEDGWVSHWMPLPEDPKEVSGDDP